MTTADSSTQALPDGTLATTTTAQPTRMMGASGAWATIDPTLERNPDGTITTTATPNALTLSGGGTGPVVTSSDTSGHAIALSLPVSLPAPTLSGASATYADIAPGVSLTITAQPSGDFSEVFTVASAADTTSLADLAFSTTLTGLTLTEQSDGSLVLADTASGTPVMSAPPAILWDSAIDGAPANGVPDDFETVTDSTSSPQGPGMGAHTGHLTVTDAEGTLTLNGNAGQLDTAAPTYPLYYDPTYTWDLPYQSGGTDNYSEAQSGCPDYPNWDSVSQPGVGYNDIDGDGDCPGYGAYESFFELNTANLNSSDLIKSSTFEINEVYSAQDSCGEGTQTVSIKWTGGISGATRWSQRPAPVTTVSEPIDSKPLKTVGNENGTMCSGGTVSANMNVYNAVAANAAGNNANITFGLYGDESGSWLSLERFNNNPSLYTVYDIAPNTPTNLAAVPAPISSSGAVDQDCGGTTVGFMGIADIGGQHVAALTAKLTSPIASAQMQGIFTLNDTTTNTTSNITSSGYVTTGASVSINTPTLADGHQYAWSLYSTNEYDPSPHTATCRFQTDFTPPNNPTVTSTDYTPLGNSTASKPTGQSGTFTLSSADPAPSGGVASGLSAFLYSFDTPVPAIGAASVSASGNSAALTSPTFTAWGVHTLYVQAKDKAGNVSAPTQYSFYVPWNSSAKVTPGDIDGDGIPDLVAPSGTGLIEYKGGNDPSASPKSVSTQTSSPHGDTWTNYLTAHSGSYTNQSVDDLWAFDTVPDTSGDNHLYLYQNTSGTYTDTSKVSDITKAQVLDDSVSCDPAAGSCPTNPCISTASTGNCNDYLSTWNDLTQLLAVGDLYTGSPQDSFTAGTTVQNIGNAGLNDLLTVENHHVWLYQAYWQYQVGTTARVSAPYFLKDPIELSSADWTGYTLIAPGLINGAPTLWARNDATGALYQYTITFDTNGYPKAIGAPSGGTALTLPGNVLLPASAYPHITSPGNLHNTGNPDLVATTATNELIDYPGTAPTSGKATFGLPQALGNTSQYSANPSYTFPSDNAVYPSGSTWKTATTTLSFDQGLLTLTNNSTGAVTAQYGATGDPNAYVTLRSDGDLVIYNDITSAAPSVVWALNHMPNVNVASGDTLQLSSTGTLTLNASGGSVLWTAPSTGSAAAANAANIAYITSSAISVQTVNQQNVATGAQPATGTNPAITALSTGGYLIAYHAAGGDLQTVDASGQITDTGHAMATATSPAIAPLGNGAWIIAFQASDGDFAFLQDAGAPTYTLTYKDTGQAMAASTSPAVDSSPLGWAAAFQGGNTDLFTYNGNGTMTDTTIGLASGTSPAIACLTTPSPGGCEIAAQANTKALWTYDTAGAVITNSSLGMQPGTSPSIAALPGGTWAAAFQANTNVLWTVNYGLHNNQGLNMQPGSNPSITALPGGNIQIAYQSSTAHLMTTNTITNTDTGATTAGSPSLSTAQLIYPS